MVKAHFADLEVEDRLKVEEGGPPREQWLGAVSFGLKQLSHLKKGSARLLNAGIKVDGEARSGSDYAEVKKALAGPMPAGLTVLNDNVRPPFADPYIFSATLGPNALTLTGSVPNENVRKQLKDMSRRLFERPTLDDQLELASGAPKNWKDAVEASLRALSRLELWQAHAVWRRPHHRGPRPRQGHCGRRVLSAEAGLADAVLLVGKHQVERG